jgi:lipopolysaccharide transport system ATP-binding protein
VSAVNDVVIRTVGLSKRYRIGRTPRNLRDSVAAGLWRLLRRPRSPAEPAVTPSPIADAEGYFWALRDVSIEVRRGEVIGIVGGNGAGKTTLLSILARITLPTSGYADVTGRVGTLLAIGTGFNAELSGRENVYVSGAMLGMKKREIDRRFDEIVAFSGIEPFLDTQVKHYSNGMFVRIAFSVAAHLNAEILLIDEVLSVGDVAFRARCMEKMHELAAQGRTILLVSHDMTAINALCRTTLLLEHGNLTFADASAAVTALHVTHQLGEGSPPGSLA